MSANLVVDLQNTCVMIPSVIAASGDNGGTNTASGAFVGATCDLINANTFCNLYATGRPYFASGGLIIQVQTSDSDTSGTFTDPTSGLAQLPTNFQSGGQLFINSGGNLGFGTGSGGGFFGLPQSGQIFQSGFCVGAGFQRPGRFVRAVVPAVGFFAGSLVVGFISQQKTTGSGGGFTMSPSSGVVNV